MHGLSHLAYGFIIAEIFYYFYIRKSGEATQYNRIMFWILGAIGGWSPDMDSLGGFFEDLFVGNPIGWNSFIKYHREFSHSIIFLLTILCCTFWLGNYIKKTYRKEKIENWKNVHPLGEVPLEKNGLTMFSFFLIIIAFAGYNTSTKYVITFIILAALVFFTWTLVKIDKPFYGLVFFIGAISHHFLDAFKCEWNPFGPWRGDIEIGMFTYCRDNGTPLFRSIMTFIFETTPVFIVLTLIISVLISYLLFKKQEKEKGKQ